MKMPTVATADIYASRRVRTGKTDRDRKSGAFTRRENNRQARGDYTRWCKSTESKVCTTGQAINRFPAQCNSGNGNSSNRRPERRPGRAV